MELPANLEDSLLGSGGKLMPLLSDNRRSKATLLDHIMRSLEVRHCFDALFAHTHHVPGFHEAAALT